MLDFAARQAGTCCGMQGREWERDPETRHEHVSREKFMKEVYENHGSAFL